MNKPDEIEVYFGDGSQRGLKLNYHLQREAWGDAGAVRWAFNAIDETVLLLPADILIDLNIEQLRAFHESHGGGLTVLVTKSPIKDGNQPVLQLFNGQITGLHTQRETADCIVSTGVFLLSPEIIEKIPHRKNWDILQDLIPTLLNEGVPVYSFEYVGFWNSLQTFVEYRDAQFTLLTNGQSNNQDETQTTELKFLTLEGKQVSEGVWIGRNNAIHPSAQIAPIFYLHDNCQIAKQAQIGPNVVIGRSVVVDQEATICDSVILDHTYIGRMLNVQSKVIYKNLVIDIPTGEHVLFKDQFLLAENRDEYVDLAFKRIASSAIALVFIILLLPILFVVALFLGLTGTSIFTLRQRMHTDIRWFVPVEERGLRKFNLLQFQVFRKNGSYVPFGKVLESSQIYRIPELINVIKGDLAFVGVKPLSEETISQLKEDWQRTRFSVPAGITGLWYLRTDDHSSFDQILIADAYYAATRNIKEDIKILLQTPKVWLGQIKKLVIAQ